MKKHINIFLVEDDEDDQFFFREALSEIENATLLDVASNGKEALMKLSTFSNLPDYIFLDLNMPLMNGFEFLDALFKIPVIKDIPVIILSTTVSQVQKVRDLGARGYIKKPADIDVLKIKIEELINAEMNMATTISDRTFNEAIQLSARFNK